MLRLLADENLDNDIVRGLRRRAPGVDIVRAQDVGLMGENDPTVLAWAAQEGRIVVTHDVNTMTAFLYDLLAAGHTSPGVVAVPRAVLIGQAIEELHLLVEAGSPEDCANQVTYLPL